MAFLHPTTDKKRFVAQWLWFGLWLGTTGVALAMTPNDHGHGTHQQLGLPPCPSVMIFNRPCPACGLTTSWTAFVHGDFGLSFEAHPFGPFLYLAFTWTAIMALVGAVRKLHFRTDTKVMNTLMGIVAVVFFGFGLFRMATTYPYRSPAEEALRSHLPFAPKPAPDRNDPPTTRADSPKPGSNPQSDHSHEGHDHAGHSH